MKQNLSVNAKSIQEYIADFPSDIQLILNKIYKTIKEILPKDVEEKISYGIPTFKLKENLVHFGGYKAHIGFYPGSQAIVDFAKDLKAFKVSKGTIQFPLSEPIPYELIKKITLYRLKSVVKK